MLVKSILKSIYSISAIALIAFVGNNAFADDTSDGCGLGWGVTKKTSFSATTTRGTTNYFAPPTFGMTSGTSGCAQHPLAKTKEKEAFLFAQLNAEPLKIDIAQGRGEYLTAFASTLGCQESVVQELSRTVQGQYEAIQSSSDGLYSGLRKAILSQPSIARGCQNLGAV